MPPTLTRLEIAAGALSIVDGAGPNRVTARALGAALHVAPATLYTVVDSLTEVDAAARELLLERLSDVLAVEGNDELQASFLSWALEHRNAALFLTDPTSSHLDLAPRLFRFGVTSTEIEQIADLQAIVHSMIAVPEIQGELGASVAALIDIYSAVEPTSTSSAASATLVPTASTVPTVPTTPTLLELALQTIEAQASEARTRTIRSVGATLVDTEGLEGWAFRRVVDESGVPLTTLHRLGDRMAHLQRVKYDLSAGAWLRSGLVDTDLATRVAIATAEVASSGMVSLLEHLRRPAAGIDWLGPLFLVDPATIGGDGVDVIDLTDGSRLTRFDQLMRAIGAIVVSRYCRRDVAPERWAAMPALAGALTAEFLRQ